MAVDVRGCETLITAHICTYESLSERSPEAPAECIPAPGYYQIDDKRQSECALILFAQHTQTTGHVVMKILHEYKDTRYNLETESKRQQCQLEALERNRVFTPEVYIGLARIQELDLCQQYILLDDTIKNPTQAMLEPEAEYALVMRQLPEERRLDHLLKEESEDTLKDYMHLLSKYVAHVHTHLVKPLEPDEDETQWGSYEQLHSKLLHNFELLDLVLTTQQNSRCRCHAYNQLEDRLIRLKDTLKQIFTDDIYRQYFDQRRVQQRMKHCHGDLKAPHIWIASHDGCCEQEPWENVSLLDAADFNSSYTHIDVLSDLALLVVDVQARAQWAHLADVLMENYLLYTNEQDEPSRAVLAYYLVEKAIVGTAISLVYDNLPDLGWAFLAVAEMRLQCLVEMQHHLALESGGSSRNI